MPMKIHVRGARGDFKFGGKVRYRIVWLDGAWTLQERNRNMAKTAKRVTIRLTASELEMVRYLQTNDCDGLPRTATMAIVDAIRSSFDEKKKVEAELAAINSIVGGDA